MRKSGKSEYKLSPMRRLGRLPGRSGSAVRIWTAAAIWSSTPLLLAGVAGGMFPRALFLGAGTCAGALFCVRGMRPWETLRSNLTVEGEGWFDRGSFFMAGEGGTFWVTWMMIERLTGPAGAAVISQFWIIPFVWLRHRSRGANQPALASWLLLFCAAGGCALAALSSSNEVRWGNLGVAAALSALVGSVHVERSMFWATAAAPAVSPGQKSRLCMLPEAAVSAVTLPVFFIAALAEGGFPSPWGAGMLFVSGVLDAAGMVLLRDGNYRTRAAAINAVIPSHFVITLGAMAALGWAEINMWGLFVAGTTLTAAAAAGGGILAERAERAPGRGAPA